MVLQQSFLWPAMSNGKKRSCETTSHIYISSVYYHKQLYPQATALRHHPYNYVEQCDNLFRGRVATGRRALMIEDILAKSAQVSVNLIHRPIEDQKKRRLQKECLCSSRK